MFPKFKVTEIYCMADDLCKEFALQQKKYMVENKNCKHRNYGAQNETYIED